MATTKKQNLFDMVINDLKQSRQEWLDYTEEEKEDIYNADCLYECLDYMIKELEVSRLETLKRNNNLESKLDWFSLRDEVYKMQTITIDKTIKNSNYLDIKLGKNFEQHERNGIFSFINENLNRLFKLTKELGKLQDKEQKLYENYLNF
ncbi:MAG: hypothetical protein ACTH0S_08640 [Senegalia sp. (in: firmicutes)]